MFTGRFFSANVPRTVLNARLHARWKAARATRSRATALPRDARAATTALVQSVTDRRLKW